MGDQTKIHGKSFKSEVRKIIHITKKLFWNKIRDYVPPSKSQSGDTKGNKFVVTSISFSINLGVEETHLSRYAISEG